MLERKGTTPRTKPQKIFWRLFNDNHRLNLTIGLFVLIAITYWVDRAALSLFKANLNESLTVLLNTNQKAIELWSANHLMTVRLLADSPEILAYIQQLEISRKNPAALLAAQSTLRQKLEWVRGPGRYKGYLIIGQDNVILGSPVDANLGRKNPLLAQPDTLARMWAGETVLSRPLVREINNGTSTEIRYTMFVGAPVKDKSGELVALMLLRMDPVSELLPLLQTSRQFHSGESYIFDRSGRLLSESRFTEQLQEIGLLDRNQNSMLHLDIRDPQIDLSTGKKATVARPSQPLTRMAASAIRGERGSDVDGYRSYRGSLVVGAWLWDDKLAMGLAVEEDVRTAFAPFYASRRTLLGFAGFVELLLIAIVVVDRRARKKLLVSQTRLQGLVDTLADGVVVIDEMGLVESINPAAVALFGYDVDEVVRKDVSLLIPELDHSEHDSYLSPYDETGEARMSGRRRELFARHKDGRIFPIDLSLKEMDLESQRYFTGIIRDISDRKAAEEKLKNVNAELRLMALVARETESAVIITDRNGQIVWVNNGFCRITEYGLAEVIGKRPRDFLEGADTDPDVVMRMGKALRAGKAVKEEILNYTKSGRPYWVQLQIAPVFDDKDNVTSFVALEQDITERRRTVSELQLAKEAAEDASRAKSAFLATMSHEIRTPMNGVIGMIDVLRRTQLNDTQHELLENAKESGFALLAIIDDILDFSKIEAGRLELERVPVSVGKLVETVSETVLPIAYRNKIELLTFCDPSMPIVFADAVRLRQILLNLLGNAVKFTGGNESRAGRIVLTAAYNPLPKGRAEIVLRVEDNGIGMSAETQSRLFQPFLQGESSTTRRFGGTGLGLTICRRLVALMGGSIDAESREGEGSTFFVRLNCEVAPDETPQHPFDLSGLNVLLLCLHPDEVSRTLLESYLKSAGASVTLATEEESVDRLVHDLGQQSGEHVVLIDRHRNLGLAEALRERIRHDIALAHPRFVMLARGRRRGVRQETYDSLTLDLDALRRETLLHAVAAAANRAPLDRDPHISDSPLNPPEPNPSAQLILVAEDNETNQKVFAHQIRILGHVCKIVGNGREALEQWRRGQYALVLTDCDMPEMDGYELARRIRQEEGEKRHVPIIAATADALKGTKELCLAAGMDDYVPKPIQLNELQQKLDKWLSATQVLTSGTEATRLTVTVSDGDVVDPSALKEVLGIEDQESLGEFYADFLRTGKDSVSAVCSAYAGHEGNEVSAVAHRLKSSARTIGAHALADCCLALEQAGKLGDWPAIDKHIAELPYLFIGVQNWIKDFSAHMTER